MNKKDLIVVALATFCFTATLFMVLSTRGQSGDYDPWVDLNDDGSINILESILVGNHFLTNGDPAKNVNVTNLPPSFVSSHRVNVSWWSYGSSYSITPTWPWIDAPGYSRMSVQLTVVDWDPHPTTGVYTTTVSVDTVHWFIEDIGGGFNSMGSLAANATVTFFNEFEPGSPISSVTLKPTEIIAPHFFVKLTITSTLEQGSVIVDLYVYLRNE